ncbi:hypothetical protein KFE25_005902 [Diacronema lutheri]|uniref:SCD domain-containing protein n=1 Tax=Diacronema lutheri TaxID=2081491 RepID=A0A8J6CC26_DIALT|nr:hypothetical protein KFE25_005902 [Diacronema lutheri]
MRERKVVVYNEQALLKQSQPETDEAEEHAPAKRARSSHEPAPRARNKAGETRNADGPRSRAPRERVADEAVAEDDEAAFDGVDDQQGNPSELPPGTDNEIYLSLTANGAALSSVVDDWLESFEKAPGEALLELLNFSLAAAGVYLAVTSDDALTLDTPAVLEQLVQAASAEGALIGGKHYPLMRSTPEFRRLRARTADFLELLVAQAMARELLVPPPAADAGGAPREPDGAAAPVRWLLDAFVAMASNAVRARALRHTGTFLAFRLCDGLLRAHAAAGKDEADALAQLDARRGGGGGGGKKKGGAQSGGALSSLEAAVAAKSAARASIGELAASLFDATFPDRYRDTAAPIRQECAASLGGWIASCPSLFLDNVHLKYLGWMLSDRDGAVRAAALDAIGGACATPDRLAHSRVFLTRFSARLVEMTNDVAAPARVAATKLLCALVRVGAPPAGLRALPLAPLVNDEDAHVRAAAVELLLLLDERGGGDADGGGAAGGGGGAAAGKGGGGAAGGAASGTRGGLAGDGDGDGARARLRQLAAQLAALTAPDASGDTLGGADEGDAEPGAARAARIAELFADASKSDRSLLDFDALLDAATSVDDAGGDAAVADARRAGARAGGAGVARSSARADNGPESGAQLALLSMLGATLRHAKAAASAGGRKSVGAVERAAAGLDAAHARLAAELASLVDGSRHDAPSLLAALRLVHAVPVSTFADRGLRAALRSLMRALDAVYAARPEHAVLVACARAWRALCSGGHALQADARLALSQVADRLVAAASELRLAPPARAQPAAGGGARGARKRTGGAGGSAGGGEADAEGERAQLLAGARRCDFESAALTLRRLRVLSVHTRAASDRQLSDLCSALLREQLAAFEGMAEAGHIAMATEGAMAECAISLAHVLRAALLRAAAGGGDDDDGGATPRGTSRGKGAQSGKRASGGAAATPPATSPPPAAGARLLRERDDLIALVLRAATEGACAANETAIEALEIAADLLIALPDGEADGQPTLEPSLAAKLVAAAHAALDEAPTYAAASAHERDGARGAADGWRGGGDGGGGGGGGGARESTEWLEAELRERVVLVAAKLAHRRALPTADAAAVALRALARDADEPCAQVAAKFWALAQLQLGEDETRTVELAALAGSLEHATDRDEPKRLVDALGDAQRTVPIPTGAGEPSTAPRAATHASATVSAEALLASAAVGGSAHTPRGAGAKRAAARAAWAANLVLHATRAALAADAAAADAAARAGADGDDDDENGAAAMAAAERALRARESLLEDICLPLIASLSAPCREHLASRLEDACPTNQSLEQLLAAMRACANQRGKAQAASARRRSGARARELSDDDEENEEEDEEEEDEEGNDEFEAAGSARVGPSSEPLPDAVLDEDEPAASQRPARRRAAPATAADALARGRGGAPAAAAVARRAPRQQSAQPRSRPSRPPMAALRRGRRDSQPADVSDEEDEQDEEGVDEALAGEAEAEADDEPDESGEEGLPLDAARAHQAPHVDGGDGGGEARAARAADVDRAEDSEEEDEAEEEDAPAKRSRFAPKKRRFAR